MVLTGSFEWKPKQHNLRVLLTKIMPRIRSKLPRATLLVVGKGVPADLRTLAKSIPGVTVTGPVPDVRPYVWQASLVLNYLESGGGIALKVLEAMAMKKPVLSNSLGCEGIEVEPGRDVFLADGADSFAEAAVNLLHNQSRRNLLSEFGRKKVERMYSWAVIAGQLTRCYESILAERSGHGRSSRSVPSAAVSVASAR
jgi:glycosyltransferase involved in cell wall biosynthesis